MGTWIDELNDDEQTKIDQLNAKGLGPAPKQQKQVGFFDGVATSPFRGAAVGFAKTADVLYQPFYALEDRLAYTIDDMKNDGLPTESYDSFKKRRANQRNAFLVEGINALEDRQNTGTAGQIGLALGDYGWRGFVGGATGGVTGAATLTAGTTGSYVYTDLTQKGVDHKTALKVASTNALVDGVATALPMSYGFKGTGGALADYALSVGGATGIMQGGQAISHHVLQDAGYTAEAQNYQFSKEGLATDFLLNSLLFGGARYFGSKQAKQDLNSQVDQELHNLSTDQIEAKNSAVDTLLAHNEVEFDNSSLKTTDPVVQNKHYQNLDSAMSQIQSGQPVNVPNNVQRPKANAAQIGLHTGNLWAKEIARRAEDKGINPADAVIISHIETGGKFDPNIQPKDKNGKKLSSATGLFQTLDSTFYKMGGKDKNNGNDQITAGLNYYKHNADIFKKKFGRDPNGLEVYFMHFFGEGGGPTFLKAKDGESFVDVATRFSKPTKTQTARQVAEGITKSHGFQNMTVGDVKSKYQQRWNDVAKKYGTTGENVSTATGMDGSSYDMQYEIKSLDDLIASNDRMYGVNSAYPQELQPRDRTRAASIQQIQDMADNLRPEWLGESHRLSDGAPIIGHDNVVESGNGRTLAITKAYENGKAEEYRKYIENYAREKGWDISGINNPVLVRKRLTETDRVQFAKLANESDVSQFSTTERAASDSQRLPDSTLLKINGDGSVNLDGSMDYVRQFINNIPKSERSSMMTEDGHLSQDGKRRIESAIAQHAYGDSNLITRLSENLDDNSKSVLNALLRVAPQLSQLNDLVKQGGRHKNSIAADLAQAAQKLNDLKANGLTVRDYLNQNQLIPDGLSSGARDYLNVFSDHSRSSKAIGDHIQNHINDIEAKGDPRQGSLFGDTPEQKAALDIINQNPDQEISVSRTNSKGEVEEITMTLKERLAELEAEAKQADLDILATETAISCALQFGV
ncbi:lytic transglycosylase domain-containing protein [Acinetobacter sp. ANC 4640]